MGESDKNEIYISPAPHISTPARTWHIMLVVIVLLLPLAGYGIYLFGLPAAITIAVSVCGAVAFESLFRALTKQENGPFWSVFFAFFCRRGVESAPSQTVDLCPADIV